MKTLVGVLAALLVAVPVLGGVTWVCPPEEGEVGCVPCPPAEAEAVYMCIDGQAVAMQGRLTTGVSLRGPFSDGYYYTFVRLGYEHPVWPGLFMRAGLGISNPFTPFCTVYAPEIIGKYHLSDNLAVMAGLDFSIWVTEGLVETATWSMPVGVHYAFGGLAPGLGIWVTGHIPTRFDPTAVLFGASFTGGIEFRW